ncbi:MAG: methylated-DNA--[protein]-cysteine S-methyltransferase [Polynucleobacter sp.]|jgi:methylated-DNA-[protein]-cysteine S-methyltransferase
MTRSSHKQPIHIVRCIISCPFGSLRISTELVDGSLMISEISYLAKGLSKVRPQNDLARQAKDQIEAYFEDPLFKFNLPLKQQGTPYQHRVWSAISDIPVGNTISYGDLAKQIKSGPRAVGGACGANYYPLLIPCHRVLSANGLGGFMQQGGEIGRHLDIKRWLLRHEGIEFIKP